jgi:pimeloyl-ACP methyl ester carboxylesterase
MTYNINQAFLASLVYDINPEADIGKRYSSSTGTEFTLVMATNKPDGYQGALFLGPDGSYILASRGTEPFSGADWSSNFQMGAGIIPDQFASAQSFLNRAQSEYQIGSSNLSLVGHSLGGSLTQMLAAENPQLTATTFNPYGAGNLVPSGVYNNVTNHLTLFDPVSALRGSSMIGNTFVYADPFIVRQRIKTGTFL